MCHFWSKFVRSSALQGGLPEHAAGRHGRGLVQPGRLLRQQPARGAAPTNILRSDKKKQLMRVRVNQLTNRTETLFCQLTHSHTEHTHPRTTLDDEISKIKNCLPVVGICACLPSAHPPPPLNKREKDDCRSVSRLYIKKMYYEERKAVRGRESLQVRSF